MQTKNDTSKPKTELKEEAGESCPGATCSASRFRKELEALLNCHNQESRSATPDFILADYLADCLAAFDKAVTHRAYWYGHKTQPVPCDPPCEPNVKAHTPLPASASDETGVKP